MKRWYLASIIVVAIAVRATLLWLTRPEFVGWFNHSYYYWVQTRSILINGHLAYADLPLLFYSYAAIAKLLVLTGIALQPAIVNTTRIVMSVVPALIAIPASLLVRRINGNQRLGWEQWSLVGVAAFLPLTITHLPEMLQKNTVGLLLLLSWMYATYGAFDRRTPSRLGLVLLFSFLIALTHVGTLAVMVLFAFALLMAVANERDNPLTLVGPAATFAGFALACLVSLRLLDPEAFARVLRYARSSAADSLLGSVFSADSFGDRALLLAAIAVPVLVVALLIRYYVKKRNELSAADRILWFASILQIWLLVLPLFDLAFLPRLIVFMPLPALVVLSFHVRYGSSSRMKRFVVGAVVAGATLLFVGETQNLYRLYPDKAIIHEELRTMRDRFKLTEGDFVLSSYAVNPVCNWFLGTRSGLITSFNENDVGDYERLFVLNTTDTQEGAVQSGDEGHVYVRDEKDRYAAMRQNIRMPAGVVPLFSSEHLSFYQLDEIPRTWLFDADGEWVGWRGGE